MLRRSAYFFRRARLVTVEYTRGMQIRQARYKLYPNRAQLEKLKRWNALHGDLQGACIEGRHRAWAKGKSLFYYDQQNEFPALKAEFPEYLELGSRAL